MSTPQNGGQMKTKIDQDITSKQGIKKSIDPLKLGTHLKVFVDYVEARTTAVTAAITSLSTSLGSAITALTGRVTALEEAELPVSEDAGNVLEAREGGLYVPTPPEGGAGQASVLRYPKDDTITENEIGLLAMHKTAPLTVEGDLILSLVPDIFFLFVYNVIGGDYAVNDEITQDSATATITGLNNIGGGVFVLYLTVTEGSFTSGNPITNGTVTADVIAAPSNVLEIGQSVVLQGNEGLIGNGTVSEVDGSEATIELIDLVGNLNDVVSVFVNGESFPAVIAEVDIENSTLPDVAGGGDVATLCQTTPTTEGEKMEFDLRVASSVIGVTIPTLKIIKISFNGDNIQNEQRLRIAKVSDNSQVWDLVFKNSASGEGECQIGATLSDTLDNLEAKLADTEDVNSLYLKVIARDGVNSIDIELLGGLGELDINNAYLGYYEDCYFSLNLGDDMSGGYATYSVIQALANPSLALLIANKSPTSNLVTYEQINPPLSLDFLKWFAIHTWSGGTPAEMGLVWFTDGEDFTDAVAAALGLDSDFTDNFEVVESSWDSEANEAVIRVRKLESFDQTLNYSFGVSPANNLNQNVSAETAVAPTATIPKMVRATILGEIVGIEGDEVLISSSLLGNATLAGNDEGISVNSVQVNSIPLAEMGYVGQELHGWDNGKVISTNALHEFITDKNLAVTNYIRINSMILGGAFMPLSGGNGNIDGKKVVKVTRNSSFLNNGLSW